MKEELVKFYIWQRNNCNKVEELKDINEMVDIYLSQKQESKSDTIPDVMLCVKSQVQELVSETKEAYKTHRDNNLESTALTSKAMNYAYQIVLDIIDRYEA